MNERYSTTHARTTPRPLPQSQIRKKQMLNKVQLIGRVGKDPELKYMQNGDAVCNFSIATTESWKDKNSGEKRETTEWHRIQIFRKLGEIAGQYLKKGSLVYIEGKIKTREYTDKEGVKRYVTEITADEMKMLGKKDDSVTPSAPPASRPHPTPSTTTSAGLFDDIDDDIPF